VRDTLRVGPPVARSPHARHRQIPERRCRQARAGSGAAGAGAGGAAAARANPHAATTTMNPRGDWTTQAGDPNDLFRSTGPEILKRRADAGDRQGLTLVHFSAQPEPLLFTEARASVLFSAQPATFMPMQPLNIAHKMCSRQAEKWTRVATRNAHVELRGGRV